MSKVTIQSMIKCIDEDYSHRNKMSEEVIYNDNYTTSRKTHH